MLPMSVIKALGLPILADEARLDLAGGETTMAALAFAEIEWLEKTVPVLIIIKDEYLLGSQLLEDTELVINYRIRTVSISN